MLKCSFILIQRCSLKPYIRRAVSMETEKPHMHGNNLHRSLFLFDLPIIWDSFSYSTEIARAKDATGYISLAYSESLATRDYRSTTSPTYDREQQHVHVLLCTTFRTLLRAMLKFSFILIQRCSLKPYTRRAVSMETEKPCMHANNLHRSLFVFDLPIWDSFSYSTEIARAKDATG